MTEIAGRSGDDRQIGRRCGRISNERLKTAVRWIPLIVQRGE
jgi:hypothetical protein